MDIDKIVSIVRTLKEEGMITNVVGNGEKSLGYNTETGTPPVWKGSGKKTYAKGGKNSRKLWLKYLKQNNNIKHQ
jgi:hypothetical protein